MSLIATAVCLANGPVVRNDWVSWDDDATLYANPDFNPPTFATLLHCWQEERGALYIPVTYTYWWTIAKLSHTEKGLSPSVFHAASIGLHLVSAWLVLAIALRTTDSVAAACAGALVFAVHPVQVESVAWASGAKDLLTGMLSLAAIWLFLLRHEVRSSWRRHILVAASTVLFVLALLAKPSAVVVPLILLAVDWLVARRLSRELLCTVGIWLVLALPVAALTRHIQTASTVAGSRYLQRPIVALDAMGFYIRSLLWPVDLTFVYGRTPTVQLKDPWLNVIVAIGTFALLVWSARRWPVIAATATIFVAALLPYLGLTLFDFQTYSTVSDHYLYLAMLGPALAVACLLRERSSGWWIGAAAVLAVWALVSHQQTHIWRNPMRLLKHAVATNPDLAAPHYALALRLASENDNEKAEAEFRRAIELAPTDPESHTSFAHFLFSLERSDDAVDHYRMAVEYSPHDTAKLKDLAVGLAAVGLIDEAESVLRRALAEPDDSNDKLVYGNLGWILLRQGRTAEARHEFEQALAIDPNLDIAQKGLEQLDRQQP